MKTVGVRVFTIGLLFCALPSLLFAQSLDELKKQVDDNAAQITQLNKEIAQYEAQLKTTTTQKNTLQNKINQLDLQRKKLQTSIQVTQKQINTTQTQIVGLNKDIQSRESSIAKERTGLAEAMRRLAESESMPLAVAVLSANDLASAWSDADALNQINVSVHQNMMQLASEQKELSVSKSSAEEKKQKLVTQQETLSEQQGSLTATRQTQAQLLAQTKEQESNYQKILAQKRAQEASFEKALTDLQAKLNYTVNPNQITTPGKGVLHYPLDTVRVTQYFGNTAFAASGAYSGKGHNGVDFAAPIGTPIKAALAGTVLGVGNTDSVRGCYSFGKWVMVKHSNGLNTMYAHLSQITAVAGQTVTTGQVLGYSGETGYATGPHLHFGVYVSSATTIQTLGSATKSATPCANATMPITPLSGYLNPMSYL